MATLFANNASAPIASSITTSSTTITVSSGQGSEFPAITGTDVFFATLVDTSNNLEIVKVTARSGDVMTVVRAQESTVARAYAAGSLFELRITAAVLSNFAQIAGDQTFTGIKTFSSTIVGSINGNAVTATNSTTQSPGDNTIKIATTAFVAAALATLPSASIPSGSVTNFYQSAAPTGWTQVTTMNDYALRIVSGTGGTTGGTTAFSTVFANQTPTINVSGLSAAATTLSTAQMPVHSHTYNYNNGGGCGANPGNYPTPSCGSQNSTGNAGSGGSHTHAISGSATSSAVTLNVLYQNHILCSKN